MGEETQSTIEAPPRGILKNKTEKKTSLVVEPLIVPEKKTSLVVEPLIVPEKAHILCPTDATNPKCDSTTREFLLHKRSSLTHTPDIARVFGMNAKQSSVGGNSLHEFQKIKLRHVDASVDSSNGLLETKKDVVVSMTAGPCKYDFITTRENKSPPRKSSYENYRPFGERSSSFTQITQSGKEPSKDDDDDATKIMSSSMIAAPSSRRLGISPPRVPANGRKPLITRGESNASSIKKASQEKRSSSIFRESQVKNTSPIPPTTENCTKTVKDAKKISTTIKKNVSTKDNSSNVSESPCAPEKSIKSGAPKAPSKPHLNTSPSSKGKASKENKMPVKGIKKQDVEGKSGLKEDSRKPSEPRVVRKPGAPIKKALPSHKTSSKETTTPAKKPAVAKSPPVKKTPEPTRRRVPPKPSTVDREAMKSKSRQSPGLVRKTPPSPETRKKVPKRKDSEEVTASVGESEENKKRPERVSGIFRPTQSWLCYMGEKAPGIKSRTPSPARKRSETRKTSTPVRRTESFNSKKKNSLPCSETGGGASSLQRSSSLRSSSGREEPVKRSSFKKAPPTLPKPGKAAAHQEDSGIEEPVLKASSVIQKFEAGSSLERRTPLLGFPENNTSDLSNNKVLPLGLTIDDPSRPSTYSKTATEKLLPNSSLSPIMVTNEEYSTQKKQSHSRSGSVVSGDNSPSNSGGYQSGEKYKTTMVVRLHPGQSRKLSNCSSTTTESPSSPSHSSMSREGSLCRTQEGSLSSSSGQQTQHRYSADIHGSECETRESNSCCASGLEITFQSPPQTIDIKLIPSPSVEERKAIEGEEEGKNLVSQELTNKTRQ